MQGLSAVEVIPDDVLLFLKQKSLGHGKIAEVSSICIHGLQCQGVLSSASSTKQ